jgi:hypothetical protein
MRTGYPLSVSQRLSTASTCSISLSERGRPRKMPCHFSRHPRQHVAVACWTMKIGCPRIGVCRPSFRGAAGANRSSTNRRPCSNTTGSVFSARCARSWGPNRKRLRNLLRSNAVNKSSRSRMGDRHCRGRTKDGMSFSSCSWCASWILYSTPYFASSGFRWASIQAYISARDSGDTEWPRPCM